MRSAWVIFVKELKSYFLSPVAYIILTGFSLLSGWLFYQLLDRFIRITAIQRGYTIGGQIIREFTLTDDLMVPLYKNLGLLFIIMVPAITMRLFAEEKKLRTEELLFTSPLRVTDILLGKYFASITLIAVVLIPVAVFPALIYIFGSTPDMGPIISGYFGLVLLGFTLAAMGIFTSSLTENQIVAFIFCAVLEMLFFTVGLAAGTIGRIKIFSLPVDFGRVARELSLYEHFDSFTSGLISASDVCYFASLIVFFLFITRYSAESSRAS